jgi:excisionase family DNA binding protein
MKNEIENKILEKLAGIETMLAGQKTVLTFDEAAKYTGLSKSYLYKLTSTGKVPCSKPHGKMIYFERLQLDEWLLKTRARAEEIENTASTYVTLNKKGGQS